MLPTKTDPQGHLSKSSDNLNAKNTDGNNTDTSDGAVLTDSSIYRLKITLKDKLLKNEKTCAVCAQHAHRKEEHLQGGERGFILSHLKSHNKPRKTKEKDPRKRTLDESPKNDNDANKTRKLFDDIFDATPNIPTSNKFTPLASTSQEPMDTLATEQNEEDDTNDEPQTPNAEQQIRQKAQKTIKTTIKDKRPPPIIIKGGATDVARYNKLNSDLKQIVKCKYTIKFTKFNTAIHTESNEDFDNVKRAMEGSSAEWHTYANTTTKTHAYVLRGLDHGPDAKYVLEELKQINKSVKNVFKMTTLFKPLYLVVTDADVTLQNLNKNCKYLNNVHIHWERRRNEREIIQCKNCFIWGHATTNCHRQKRCPKCAGNHNFLDCVSETIKCVNCGGNHRSTDINCPVYTFKTNKLPNRRPTYMPAPPPTTNRWTSRASAPTDARRDETQHPQRR